MKIRSRKKLGGPAFESEDAEREFWDSVDLTDYFDKSDFVPVSFPNLKPTSAPLEKLYKVL
ncbi:hypothetical protein HY968_03965 [Candidatus Kaiserbacteria bacterium]|nr:hypothetical protein [Candidatus Kaiserbacteria bacterium]